MGTSKTINIGGKSKMKVKNLMAKFQFDWNCGRHSGFPMCCILWYLGPWQLIIFRTPWMWKWYWALGDGNYVRCPICLLRKHQVEMKECDCGEKPNEQKR